MDFKENILDAPDSAFKTKEDVVKAETSKGRRFLGFLIDYAIFYVMMFLLGVVSALYSWGFEEIDDFVLNILSIGVFLSYYILIETITNGRSLGKYILGTKVVKVNGEQPEINDYFVRSICRIVPFEAFSFFGSVGWHDKWSDTRVVDIKKF
ncbi:RDD family protein [Mangrovivirga sp. M17]|uniref:RDD family protein n=1 Tax=Mangrovivirga halotolerans TaxID=2993936 RepID=A0ABT3RVH2_9BACT|nr:RDD family protein [Mangrovivirga halotolerans]MCX2745772.1 RDD family protein [Mangrovivirga halotolerans]